MGIEVKSREDIEAILARITREDDELDRLTIAYWEIVAAHQEVRAALFSRLAGLLAGGMSEHLATRRTGLSRQTVRRINGKGLSARAQSMAPS